MGKVLLLLISNSSFTALCGGVGSDGDITHRCSQEHRFKNCRTVTEEASESLTLGLVVLTVGPFKLLRVVAHTGSTGQAVSMARTRLSHPRSFTLVDVLR